MYIMCPMEGDEFWEKISQKTLYKKKLVCLRDVRCTKTDIQSDRWTDRDGECNRRYLTIIQSDGDRAD